MAKAGAHVVGINCHFDPFVSLECLKKMKAGLDAPSAWSLAFAQGGTCTSLPGKPMTWVCATSAAAAGLSLITSEPWVRARARRAYWENMKPASGRPFCPAMSCPDNWGVTKGDAILVQQEEATRKEQIAEVQKIQMEKLKM